METYFVILKAFLNEKDKEPITTDVISVKVETYEILYAIKSENPIILQSITVGSSTSSSYVIENLGLHSFNFE